MDNFIWNVKSWLVETGWNLGQAWDSIGGWDGALRWIVAGVIGGCIGWLIYFLVREYRRAPLIEESIEEPITQPLQAIQIDDTAPDYANRVCMTPDCQINVVVNHAEAALSLLWEKQEREEA